MLLQINFDSVVSIHHCRAAEGDYQGNVTDRSFSRLVYFGILDDTHQYAVTNGGQQESIENTPSH